MWSKQSEVHEKGRWRKVYHGYGFGRKVYLRLRKSRYFCSTCQRAFTEQLLLITPWQRHTEGTEKQIIESLRGQSFKSVSEKEGSSYGVAKRILLRRLDPEKLMWAESGEKLSLGINVHSFRGTQMVHTVTDISAHSPLTILQDSRKKTLSRFLRNIPKEQRLKIQEVCIDMSGLLLRCETEHLPEANVVINHFHVIYDANRRVDEALKIEQDAWKVEIPRRLFFNRKRKIKLSSEREDRIILPEVSFVEGILPDQRPSNGRGISA